MTKKIISKKFLPLALAVAVSLSVLAAVIVGGQVGAASVIASGAFDDALYGGLRGAPWRLYSDGTLVVDWGFVETRWWTATAWGGLEAAITRIVITEPMITGGLSVQDLFRGLHRVVSIEGLSYFDARYVTDMWGMFSGFGATGLTSLDLSGWDTSNVTNMNFMFSNSNLQSLDLSGWDTSNVTSMTHMFFGMNRLQSLDLSHFDMRNVTNMLGMFGGISSSLRQLTLGEHFRFVGFAAAGLPAVPNNTMFTGYWQNVGAGTIHNPQGAHVLTSQMLMITFDGATMADTWVWQPRNPIIITPTPCPDCGEHPCVCPEPCPGCGEYPSVCPEPCEDCGDYPCACPSLEEQITAVMQNFQAALLDVLDVFELARKQNVAVDDAYLLALSDIIAQAECLLASTAESEDGVTTVCGRAVAPGEYWATPAAHYALRTAVSAAVDVRKN